MRSCEEVGRWLHAYLDRELDLIHLAEIEAHIHGCAACSQAYEEQCALEQSLNMLPRYRLPTELRAHLETLSRARIKELMAQGNREEGS